MFSAQKKNLCVVLNGEIYNLQEVRQKFLSNFSFRTNSDTEVLLEALAETKMESVLNSIRGMFSFALFDAELGTLSLVRDRFGEKPMHFWSTTNSIFFSSQYDTAVVSMKLLGGSIEYNLNSVHKYLTLGYFPYESSMVQGIRKAPPGTHISFDLFSRSFLKFEQQRWFPKWITEECQELNIDSFKNIFTSAVSEQLIGDVPIGVFLSGGSDSTLVSAVAQKLSYRPINSFSLGFENPKFDESFFAKSAAQQIGTNHHDVKMTSKDALELLPTVLNAFPEPLGDPSVFPTTFISKVSSEFVTVCLTGDGADELFFGYGRYQRFLQLESFAENLERYKALTSSSIQALKRLRKMNLRIKGLSRLQRIVPFLEEKSSPYNYMSLIGFGHFDVLLDSSSYGDMKDIVIQETWLRGRSSDPIRRLREIDVDSYLCDDILVKVDRAAMAFGLETRAPFLDNRIQSLARVAGPDWLLRSESKAVIKSVLGEFVTTDIFRRPKMGFGAPIGDWFRTSLLEWSSDVVSSTAWEQLGIDKVKVEKIRKQVTDGDDNSSTFFWMLVALGYASIALKS
jgi:asparagine synthase (glutamine-hydrolysing)